MLLEALKVEQGAVKDGPFAARLGIPRETWIAIKAGRVALDGRVLLRVARRSQTEFPHLWRVVLSALLPQAVDGSRDTLGDTREPRKVA